MIAETDALHAELRASGEFVGAYGVADQVMAKTVRSTTACRRSPTARTSRPRSTSAASTSSTARASERALEIAARGAVRPLRPGRGAAADARGRARRVSRPTDASRTCCASSRRRSSARSCAATATSTRARTRCRRRCSPRRCSGRADGVPDNPRAWLITVASRRLTDQLRSDERAGAARTRRRDRRPPTRPVAPAAPTTTRSPSATTRSTLLFLCCHPALSPPSQLALTLRAVGGLTTAEIARAFLVPEATMAPAHQPGQADASRPPARGSGMPPRAERADRLRRRAARALPDLQRGLHRDLGARPAARRPHRARRSGSPARAPRCCPTTARSPGCSRSCC